MKKKTLKALNGSIEHWKSNLNAETPHDVELGVDACPLCKMFNNNPLPSLNDCIGCPVRERTEYQYCKGTPYIDADKAHTVWRLYSSERDEWRAAAAREVEFLESLLPHKDMVK